MSLLEFTKKGLYCPQADVFIDARSRVDKAIITHAHSDHARRGSKFYIAHRNSISILKHSLGKIKFKAVEYGESFSQNGVKISLHPAGHIIGSAQVRLEYKDEVWVVSGDYKLENDGISGEFEHLKCNAFITESTFALPSYKWKSQKEVFKEIHHWWKDNVKNGVASVLLCYSIGKAQRVLHNIDRKIGPVYAHHWTASACDAFRKSGVNLPSVRVLGEKFQRKDFGDALVLAPSSVRRSGWLDNLEPYSLGCASGWMLNGSRWMSVDAGFALSDHADWDGLNKAVKESCAEKIYVTHGYSRVFANWLRNHGYNARELRPKSKGEQIELEFN
jgi:putative mRNA 3-end processing factor